MNSLISKIEKEEDKGLKEQYLCRLAKKLAAMEKRRKNNDLYRLVVLIQASAEKDHIVKCLAEIENKGLKEQYFYQLVSMVGGFDSAKRFNISAEFQTKISEKEGKPSLASPFGNINMLFKKEYRQQLKAKLQATI